MAEVLKLEVDEDIVQMVGAKPADIQLDPPNLLYVSYQDWKDERDALEAMKLFMEENDPQWELDELRDANQYLQEDLDYQHEQVQELKAQVKDLKKKIKDIKAEKE